MDSLFSNFYRKFFLKTGGFIPAVSPVCNLYPGDFFQIKNGELLVIGNIFKDGLVDTSEHELTYGLKLNPVNWDFYDDVTKLYSGRGTGNTPLTGDF